MTPGGSPSDPTLAVYEAAAERWHLPFLGGRAIGLDEAHTMLELARQHTPAHPVVRADLRELPFRSRSFGGLWASKSLVHLRQDEVPLALAEAHRVLQVDAEAVLVLFRGQPADVVSGEDDDVPGRHLSLWAIEHLTRVITGAGFELLDLDEGPDHRLVLRLRRLHSLPDTVGTAMRLLVVGLNPSPHASDSGVGFSRPGNRFWPAALDAGIVSVDRNPRHALVHHGVGMTDLVKRTTRRADELERSEYGDGLERLDRLCEWLRPDVVCLVGLAGWRAAFDRKARAGWQDRLVGGRPVYVMPSTSGLNASSTRSDLADHLVVAFAGPSPPEADSLP